ncbi:DNA-directed RNA polymerase [Candidatus Woesearchaeota archaeon]|nr:DNA-directed RNA polymerase [Candidatus Woesearchaeota archaeon]
MFYKTLIEDHIRVPPNQFSKPVKEALLFQIKKQYEGYISKDMGVVIDVSSIEDISDGIIIPEDGAAFYKTKFILLTYKPELQEVVLCQVKDMADFGAFMSLGPIEGMIHISQTMDDFVSFSKDKVLLGKESKKSLKIGDKCRARIIAVSYKDPTNPKFGLTMRQPSLGRIDWIQKDSGEKKGGKNN